MMMIRNDDDKEWWGQFNNMDWWIVVAWVWFHRVHFLFFPSQPNILGLIWSQSKVVDRSDLAVECCRKDIPSGIFCRSVKGQSPNIWASLVANVRAISFTPDSTAASWPPASYEYIQIRSNKIVRYILLMTLRFQDVPSMFKSTYESLSNLNTHPPCARICLSIPFGSNLAWQWNIILQTDVSHFYPINSEFIWFSH